MEILASPLHEESGARDLCNLQVGKNFTYVDKSRPTNMESPNLATNNAVNIESVARALKDLTNLTDGPSPV